jgi:hypothetical protein
MAVELAPPPNIEALVSAFLRDQPEISDDVGDRVYTAIPEKPTYPLVRVTLLDSAMHTGPAWGGDYFVQIEAFGGSKGDAQRIASMCLAVMSARLVGVHDLGVVFGVHSSGMRDQPDEDRTPAKPRFLFTSTIGARPRATVPAS